jgi:hypothetical protein
MDYVVRKASCFDKFIFGITEIGFLPKKKNFFETDLDVSHKILFARVENVRALLYCHKDIPLWFMPKFSGKDCCTGQWDSQMHGKVLISSVYWDQTIDEPPAELRAVLEFCKLKGFKHMTLMDSNAHHNSFGRATTNNPRGDKLVEFMAEFDNELLNTGGDFTFEDSMENRTLIDLTYATNGLAQSIIK